MHPTATTTTEQPRPAPGPAATPGPSASPPPYRPQPSGADEPRSPVEPLPGSLPQALRLWLDRRRNAGDTPDRIAEDLVAAGWNADAAADVAVASLRSSDRHRLAYGVLTVSAGFAALAAATSLHLLLVHDPDGSWMAASRARDLAEALTVLAAAAPTAAWSFRWTRSIEASSAHAVWSPARRSWFGALAACTAVIGLVRLLVYVYGAALALTGASGEPLSVVDLAQVAVSVAVALPLLWWSAREWRRSALLVSGLRDPQPGTTAPVPSGPWTRG